MEKPGIDLPKGYRIEQATVTEKDLVCPVCSARVMYGFGTKLGKILTCINFPKCNYIKRIEDKIVLENDVKRPY